MANIWGRIKDLILAEFVYEYFNVFCVEVFHVETQANEIKILIITLRPIASTLFIFAFK